MVVYQLVSYIQYRIVHATISLFKGIAPVVIKPPASTNISGTLPAMKLTLDLSTARAIITTHNMIRFLKSKVIVCVYNEVSLYIGGYVHVHVQWNLSPLE